MQTRCGQQGGKVHLCATTYPLWQMIALVGIVVGSLVVYTWILRRGSEDE